MTIQPYMDDPNTEAVSVRERDWFSSYLQANPKAVIEYGQAHSQVFQPNAFFLVVYVHLEECIGVRMNELAEQKLKKQEELIAELLDWEDDVRIFIHTPLIVEDQGHWSMFHCSMTVLNGGLKIAKTKIGYELQSLQR